MSAEQNKHLTDMVGKGKPDPSLTIGENIAKLAKVTGGHELMDADNKQMLEKVKEAKTNAEVTQILMTDPSNGRSMSYAESRMRFG
jgi:hypothetical protein